MAETLIKELKTLQHRDLGMNDAQKLFMMTKGRLPQDCSQLYHPNMTCNQYALYKIKYTGRTSIRIHIIGALIPELIRNYKKLKTDFFGTMKKILYTTFKSVMWHLIICTSPAIMFCRVRHYTGGMNYIANAIVYTLANLAWLIENLSKHTQYVGFLVPKNIHIIYTNFVNRGWLVDIPGIEVIVPLLTAGFIGLAASRGHY